MNAPVFDPHRQRLRLGELLIQARLISQATLEEALAEQRRSGHKLGRILVDLGFVDENELLKFLSRQLRLPLVDLRQLRIRADLTPLLPEGLARRHRALVLDETPAGSLRVAFADPTDLQAYDAVRQQLRRDIEPVLVRESDLLRTLDLVYRRTDEISTLAEQLGAELGGGDFDLAQLGEETLGDAPVARLLQTLFEDAVQMRASDIHIEPEEALLRIRQRIDGVLHEQVLEGRRVATAVVTRLKLMAGVDISEKRLPQDGRFSIRVQDRLLDVRLATLPTQSGETVVLRILDPVHDLHPLEDLGMPEGLRIRLARHIQSPHGLIVVTGPTGGGKSTTLYSILQKINRPEVKIITVEDPVEYRLARVSQIQVNPRIELGFARVLRTALRQDPDVLMVGEIRDEETMEVALRAALMGHLVLSTLHTNDAPATLERLLSMGARGYLLAAALRAVLAQRLLRRVCEGCRVPDDPNPALRAWLDAHHVPTDATFVRGRGCALCANSGHRGRIGVFEYLEIDEGLAEALREERATEFRVRAGRQPWYHPLLKAGLDLAREGQTTLSEVLHLSGETELAPRDI
ncbi:MAG: Flp pilus assembly complex ATPase component TadA [Gammaproteobacteria bacterium]|jgi:MSHA biogenesis protein MshE|nr:Flp pilus assembly complex ATPase component TadA [Gammaproteobacteria bacterium]